MNSTDLPTIDPEIMNNICKMFKETIQPILVEQEFISPDDLETVESVVNSYEDGLGVETVDPHNLKAATFIFNTVKKLEEMVGINFQDEGAPRQFANAFTPFINSLLTSSQPDLPSLAQTALETLQLESLNQEDTQQ